MSFVEVSTLYPVGIGVSVLLGHLLCLGLFVRILLVDILNTGLDVRRDYRLELLEHEVPRKGLEKGLLGFPICSIARITNDWVVKGGFTVVISFLVVILGHAFLALYSKVQN